MSLTIAESPDVLEDGAWARRGHIVVWVPTPKPIEPPPVRRCQCGAELAKWKQLCPPCLRESRRTTWRSYRRRQRGAA